ncbi:response regulator [Roseateles chitosanitabidus]|uniref:response regulator n=1 Tax=Roseateles chitosanitabidus TaxID=65048 RepID=UPI00082C93C3|nr:response regulator transcription factor [Roseateles chitosanitabidus]MBO9687854.1 response regulator transcription factor [Roseateles chitosanitabidus]
MSSPDSSTATSSGPLSCFLVEDSALIRENLVATLQEMLTLEVVGQAEDEAGALRWLHDEAIPCDLVIIDIFLKRGTGLSLLPKARLLQPEAKLVVLSNYATVDMRRRCLALGADRVFDKSGELDELIAYCLDVASSKA